MKKRIAIITGASGGLGREFVRQIVEEELEEIWAVARNEKKLDSLKKEWGDKIIPIVSDLSVPDEVHAIGRKLQEQNPVIMYLVNNAGTGKLEEYEKCPVGEIEATVNLNCTAVAVLCRLCIPYMEKGSHIINVASQASFQPLPFMATYAATKVFVRNFTRALNVELKEKGILATAVCPGWIETDLLPSFCKGKKPRFPGQVKPASVAAKAMKDIKKGRDMSVNTLYVKFLHFLAKIFPQRLACKVWLWYVKRYVGE